MVQKVWQSFSAENSGVSQNVENLFLKMKGKYDLIMLIAVDLGVPHFWTPIVFCSAVRSSHLFFVARTCSIRGKPQPFLLALRNDRNLDLNGQNISWDLVDLSKMLFLCSAPINGSMVPMALSNQGRDEATIIARRNVSRRPPMACQHPDEKHQVVNFMDVTHIEYHGISMIYR